MTKKEFTQLGKGLAFLSPWLFGFLTLTALPILMSLYYATSDYSLLQGPLHIGGENFNEMMAKAHPGGGHGDPDFWKSVKNTGYYALMALPAGMMVSFGLALLLNAKIKGQGIYRTIIFLPSLVPAVASAVLWGWIYNSKLGLINTLLRNLGMTNPPGWLTDPRWAMPSIAFMSLWGVGNTVVIYLAGLQDVPRELYEAAEIDGAGPVRRLFSVTIPMVSPVIFFNLIMAIIGTLQVFTVPMIMTEGKPDGATMFYTMALYENAFTYLKMGYASAMAWVQLLAVLALTGLAFWSSRKWVYYSTK